MAVGQWLYDGYKENKRDKLQDWLNHMNKRDQELPR